MLSGHMLLSDSLQVLNELLGPFQHAHCRLPSLWNIDQDHRSQNDALKRQAMGLLVAERFDVRWRQRAQAFADGLLFHVEHLVCHDDF